MIVVGTSAAGPQEPPPVVDLRVDCPFYFTIEARGAALFTGTVVDP